MSALKDLYTDLRQRKLTRTLLAYGAVGWAVLEGIERYGAFLPTLVHEAAPILFLMGIPYCLILGWYHGEKGRQRVSLPEVSLLTVTTAGMAAFLWIGTPFDFLRHGQGGVAEPDLHRIGVLPFSAVGGPEAEVAEFADGLTRELIRTLAEVEGLEVPQERAVMRYRESDASADSIGRALQAGLLVDGTVARTADSVVVVSTLFEPTAEGTTLWTERFAEAVEGEWVYALIERVTDDLAGALRSELGRQIRLHQWRAETESTLAWQLIQRARREWDAGWEAFLRRDLDRARSLLRGTDSLLAEVSELDRQWAEPHLLRAQLAERRALVARFGGPGRPVEILEEGTRHADRALELDPDNPRAWEARGALGSSRLSLATPDRLEEYERLEEQVMADFRRAVENDPFLAVAHSQLANLHLDRGEFQEAHTAATLALRSNAFLERPVESHLVLAEATFELGREEQALELARQGARRFEGTLFPELELEFLAWGERIEPDVERAWSLVERIEGGPGAAVQEDLRPVLQMDVAGVLARAGNADSAWAVMERAMETDPADGRLLRRRVGVLVRLGETERAVDALEDFLSRYPRRPERLLGRRMLEPLEGHPRLTAWVGGRAGSGGG